MKTKISFAIILIFFSSQISLACSVFCLIKNDHHSLLAKNLDWPIGDGHVIINKRGVKKESRHIDRSNSFTWISKYGSITFNQFGNEFPLGGMNEEGLVVEELSYSPTDYFEHAQNNLCELQWIQFQLDNYSTVSEVISNIKSIGVHKLLFGLHLIAADKNGTVSVIEFLNGEPHVYSDKSLE